MCVAELDVAKLLPLQPRAASTRAALNVKSFQFDHPTEQEEDDDAEETLSSDEEAETIMQANATQSAPHPFWQSVEPHFAAIKKNTVDSLLIDPVLRKVRLECAPNDSSLFLFGCLVGCLGLDLRTSQKCRNEEKKK